MSVAFSSKVLKYPMDHFAKIFLLEDEDSVRQICDEHSVSTDQTSICFSRTNFAKHSKQKWRTFRPIEDKFLSVDLGRLFDASKQ